MRFRVIALAASAVLLLAMPAQADHTYAGTATATGMELTLAGEGLIIGFSEAAVQSAATPDGCAGDQRACARAAGEALQGEMAGAHAPGNEGPDDTTAFALPAEFSPLLGGSIGRATAEARFAAEDSRGRGDGGAGSIQFTATQSLAEQIPIQDALQQISDEVLGPIAENDPTGLAGRLKGTLDQLNTNLTETPLLTIDSGPSFSEVTDVGGRTTARAGTQGTTIVLSPTPGSLPGAPEGLVIIEVGGSSATATTDQFTATAAADPAIVRIRIFDPLTGEYDTIATPPGETGCVPGIEGTPLQICIGVGGTDVTEQAAAAAGTADGVSIIAFQDPLPTLRMRLAFAQAGVNAAPPPAAPPAPDAPPPPDAVPDLPRTGAGVALPALGLLVVGSAAFLGVRRRRLS